MRLLLLSLFFAAPVLAQEPTTLPSRSMPYLLGQHVPSVPYPASYELSFGQITYETTNPFGERGNETDLLTGPAGSLNLDRYRFSLRLQGAFPGGDVKQLRAGAGLDFFVGHRGNDGFGITIGYRILRFSRHVADISALSLVTEREAQILEFGPATRLHGPHHTLIRGSVTLGAYANSYTSVAVMGNERASQPFTTNHSTVLTGELSAGSAPIADRLVIAVSMSYARLLRPADWVPQHEFTARVSADVHLSGRLYLGGGIRFGSREPSLFTDRSTDLHLSLMNR